MGGLLKLVGFATLVFVLIVVGWFIGWTEFPWPFA